MLIYNIYIFPTEGSHTQQTLNNTNCLDFEGSGAGPYMPLVICIQLHTTLYVRISSKYGFVYK